MEICFHASITEIPPQTWDGLVNDSYPFMRHGFLRLLEETGCTGQQSGWLPQHLTLRDGDRILGLMPLYLKSHSYGEYVFDWAWAHAWQRHGVPYYPKLTSAIPYTPATGPRLCLAPELDRAQGHRLAVAAVKDHAEALDASSFHLLFAEPEAVHPFETAGLDTRLGCQFHWRNRNYRDFDHFLADLNSRHRKNLRKERARVQQQGLQLEIHDQDFPEGIWERFHHFYQLTHIKRGRDGYLSEEFFHRIAQTLPGQVVLVLARYDGEPVAGALCFRSDKVLYGRYWGCYHEFKHLHFEACFYQGIEYCIRQGLEIFDPGAQGEHKIKRGFIPTATHSLHWVRDRRFAPAVQDFLAAERESTDLYMEQCRAHLPFRTDLEPPPCTD